MTADVVELVDLVLDYSYASATTWDNTRHVQPLHRAPRYVRGSWSSYWHRPRSGRVYGGRPVLALWCGQTVSDLRLVQHASRPLDGPVCGTCEGRALGAGQDPVPQGMPEQLTFRPTLPKRPRWCPGSGGRGGRLLVRGPDWRVGTCALCRQLLPVRSSGGPYYSRVGLVRHELPESVEPPCQLHGFRSVVPDGEGGATCACLRPGVW